MILTCPECATSYFVDDSRIPAGGRTVKCTSCGARWQAGAEPAAVAPPKPEPPPRPPPAPKRPTPAVEIPPEDLEFAPADPESELQTATALEPEPEAEPEEQAEIEPLFVSRAPKAVRGEGRGKGLAWAAAVGVVAALVGGAIAFRGEVVRLIPGSQTVYASLGLPVSRTGLVIEGVRAVPIFLGGRPVLSITGAIRNVRDEPVTAPALRVNLLNRAGKPIAAKVLHPIDSKVPAGATRHFTIAISDPPANAHDLEVVFETAPTRAAGAPAPLAPQPAPAEAQPLPAGSAEALSEHG